MVLRAKGECYLTAQTMRFSTSSATPPVLYTLLETLKLTGEMHRSVELTTFKLRPVVSACEVQLTKLVDSRQNSSRHCLCWFV